MKLKDLRHLTQEKIIELQFDHDNIVDLNRDDDISIGQMHGELFLSQKESRFQIENPEILDSYGSFDNFLWLAVSIKKNKVLIQAIPCSLNTIQWDDLEAAIDGTIVKEIAKRSNRKTITFEQATNWLKEEFILVEGNASYILQVDSKAKMWTIVGKENLLQIEVTKDNKFWVKSLKPLKRGKRFSLNRLQANLSFVRDLSETIKDPLIRQKLDDLNKSNSTYIELWNSYNKKVNQKTTELARKAGFVNYVKFETVDSADGLSWHFYFKEKDLEKVEMLKRVLSEDKRQSLEINAKQPSWLTNDIGDISLENKEKTSSIHAKFVKNTKQFIVLNLTSEGRLAPASTGVIYLSISGSEVQNQRRKQARDSITRLVNPMKNLRFLIENSDVSFAPQRRSGHKLNANTPSVRKAFKNTPTQRQMDALDVALNTPDIALILGPPGTGKTQVISALQNRLAENSQGNMTGQILLTSFQNDAVDNVVARSETFGIPAIRVDEHKLDPVRLEQWSEKQFSDLSHVLGDVTKSDGSHKIVNNIRKDIAAILVTRVDKKQKNARVKSLLEDVGHLTQCHGFNIPQSLKNDIEQHFIVHDKDSLRVGSSHLLRSVRGLRLNPVSFSDDGLDQTARCRAALYRSGKYLAEVETLDLIIDQDKLNEKHFEKLNIIKNNLLDQLIPDRRPKLLQVELSKKEVSLLHQLSDVISDHSANCRAGIPDVIDEYLDQIKFQPKYLAESVKQYTTSVGASCQRSVNDNVTNYLNEVKSSLDEVTSGAHFDTVIVDEAARANPLDLFIPMALASRRIVLVGDHFQLPQMLEPDIEKEMLEDIDAGDLQDETAKAIKSSLFERLYTQLREREGKDGFKRTVMLDTQFRMHPKLGDFVSRSFYESAVPPEPKIISFFEDDHFDLGIPKYRGKVAEWIDVPFENGKEKRHGTSWKRECEALTVAKEVQTLLQDNPSLSIGVITFFTPQKELIFEELSRVGICHKTGDDWEYLPGYRENKRGQETIRVGSVDAFQGKEFDVVVLSTVRSNNYICKDEKSFIKKYGFIRTPNRLNVAFSRAKSLIKVVGDKKMFSDETAKMAIPQVWSFIHELCEVHE
jgi:DNA replication protein DnaC